MEALSDIRIGEFHFPLIVKPVDSSGSKGVARINTVDEAIPKLNNAMSFSRGKRIIIEEYVEKFGYQIAGDGLSVDGELVFRYFADDHFNPKSENPFAPISASFPYNMPPEVHTKIHAEIQRLLCKLNMATTTYNFDLRIDKDFNVYLMEVAPRNNGNYIPDVIKLATGIDLVECAVKMAMGEKIQLGKIKPQGFYSYFAVHSLKTGILEMIQFSDEGRLHIVENHIIKKPGDKIDAFVGSNTTLGCLIMRFDSMEQMLYMMDHSFMCDSCDSVLRKYNVFIHYYSIDMDFKRQKIELQEGEWLYVVNFYGQLSEFIKELREKYKNIIVDYTHAYFHMPIKGTDTLYSCRKFFGVADGAILYTDKKLSRNIPRDESYDRMHFLLGRYERSAQEFYSEYVNNNKLFIEEEIKTMSKLTENLLRGMDYAVVKNKRTENFTYLHKKLKTLNKLNLRIPDGAYMYPLYIENGAEIRNILQKEKIYIPTLWSAVLNRCSETELEYDMAKNILPLPIDQRYGKEEMNRIAFTITSHI